MRWERIKKRGDETMGGTDAFAVLSIVFDWMEEQNGPLPDQHDLLNRLRESGYCCCTTQYGCMACGGKKREGTA